MKIFSLLSCLLGAAPALANVEKAIFLAPGASPVPKAHPNLDDLLLQSLSHTRSSVRTKLNASFPTEISQKGTESWFLLEDLNPKQRYEVRICWLATQPTEFWIYPWTLSQVFETPSLITSLTTYSYARHDLSESLTSSNLPTRNKPSSNSQDPPVSVLFLQVYAAADYFTLNKTLMESVPPVDVDILLDPYLLSVFPRSLVPTAGYICVLAVCSWFLADFVWKGLLSVGKSDVPEDERTGKKDARRAKKID